MIELFEHEINEEEIKEEEIKEVEVKGEESLETESIKTVKNQNQLIIFTKLNKYYSIFFIAPVVCMLTNYFIYKIKAPELNIVKNPYVFNMLIAELL